jgi:anti-anti-sigma regulatory factor
LLLDLSGFLVAGLAVALLGVLGRAVEARLRVVPTSLTALHELDRSLSILLGKWPELAEIRIDLSTMDSLDDSAIAALEGAIRTLSARGIQVGLDGFTPSMVQVLLSHGISTEHIGVARRMSPTSGATS